MTDTPLRLSSADGASALLHTQGAHLTHWQAADGRERLFLSEKAVFAPGVAIRGGVPVIFPQFADRGPLPKHGFARGLPWTVPAQDAPHCARLTLADTPATRVLWDAAFLATLTVTLGGNALSVRLAVRNDGVQPFDFTAALHSYLAVDDLDTLRIEGLQGLDYFDKADGGRSKREQDAELAIAGEVDRIYWNAPPALTMRDGGQVLRLEQTGFTDTVVWNPGSVASAAFGDLASEDYRRFVCIEAARIGRPVALAPGESWQGEQRFRVMA